MRRRHQRLDFPGSLHFVTAVTRERGHWFIGEQTCTAILTVFERYRSHLNLDCFGYVLMPDHLHALLLQHEEGPLVSQLMNSFKRETSKLFRGGFRPGCADLTRLGDKSTLWRNRYDDIPVPGPSAALARLEYLHANPVRRGLVANATDYRWSSARFHSEFKDHALVTLTRP